MNEQTNWFFSWVAYDSVTGERLQEYSGGETFSCYEDKSPYEVFEYLVNEYESKRENLKIHCIAFNPI